MRILNSRPGLLRLALILALAQFAVMVFPTDFVLYAGDRYGWKIGAVTACLTAFGVCSAIVQLGLSGRVVRMFGEPRVAVGGLACGVVGLLVFGLAPTGIAFIVAIPIMTLWGVAAPAVQSLMTRLVSSSEQGRLQGANTSLGSLGNVISPVLFGYLYSQVYAAVHGGAASGLLGAPFLLASAIVMIAAALAMFVRPVRLRA
jgi:DHA1 family tetracycline resistance protein-like MFS transporter